MPLKGPFPEHIDFINDWDVVVRQQVRYEWKASQCGHCKMMGHEEAQCRKKAKTRQKWRPVQREERLQEAEQQLEGQNHQNLQTQQDPPNEIEQEGFITPRRFVQSSSTGRQLSGQVPIQNNFQVLMDEASTEMRYESRAPPMDSIIVWNIRGLNSLNKQEDIKIFLEKHKIGLVALLETKVKNKNVTAIGERLFGRWRWYTNVEYLILRSGYR
ncbi:hypothetical protein Cgig2_025265 [Carnegiea gigantea]|uniref:Uncharacterized protein n=1 Tax=Carnegiea gigantea TaxID=171969 RepID=A0A9Q1JPG2_9CARY|nr:hypothetical protein Cgig2_025265 [Carnegiea gigantea]